MQLLHCLTLTSRGDMVGPALQAHKRAGVSREGTCTLDTGAGRPRGPGCRPGGPSRHEAGPHLLLPLLWSELQAQVP